jgi:hypothetical protein
LRGKSLDAQGWFVTSEPANISDPDHYYLQNEYGANFGGPIPFSRPYDGREKSFFFLSYEGLNLNQPTPQVFA